jgi:hypothetical protein
MGACNIETWASGKTMSEAYNNAVNDALHYSGHDPYNGTISTTNGFIDMTKKYKELGENEWCSKAWDNTEKWEEVWGAEQSEGKYIFAGWAAE